MYRDVQLSAAPGISFYLVISAKFMAIGVAWRSYSHTMLFWPITIRIGMSLQEPEMQGPLVTSILTWRKNNFIKFVAIAMVYPTPFNDHSNFFAISGSGESTPLNVSV